MKHSSTIRSKLFMYFILFTAFILVLLWLAQVVFLEPIYKFIKVNEIKTTAKSLSENIDRPDLVDYAFALGEQNELCILAYRLVRMPSVIVPYEYISVDTLTDCAIHKITMTGVRTLYNNAMLNDGELLQYFQYEMVGKRYESIDDYNFFNHSKNSESIIYTQTLTNSVGDEIVLMVNSVISPVGTTVKTINLQLTAISVVLIIMSIILTWIFAKRISVPIVTINNSAKILATGNYNVNFDNPKYNYKEINELADTLNYAAGELSKIDKMKSDLIANISHDLRTPLTMIVGYSEVMRDIPEENTPENVQIIIDEANRLTSLVNDVLDISKLQSGNQTFEPEPFNLTLSLKNALRRYNKLTEQNGYIIDFIYDEEIVINSDELRIMQAFYNLVNNAITYTGNDKHVTVIQTLSNGYVRVNVKDTGDGIEPDKLPYIWDRYYKVDKVHKRASIGTGLGLSIVKSIVDTAGGRCGVNSIVGVGSDFWFELPLMEGSQE